MKKEKRGRKAASDCVIHSPPLMLFSFFIFLFSFAFGDEPVMFVPYTTYIYRQDGRPSESPHAYVPTLRLSMQELGYDIRGATNITTAPDGRLYIANSVRNNILVFDENYNLVRILDEFINLADDSVLQLRGPEGVFVHERTGNIFIADTGNRRILELTPEFTLIRQILGPQSAVLPEGFVFLPSNLVVDSVGRIFILVRNNLMGLVQMDSDGGFIGFFGAQQVNRTAFDTVREFFMTEAQRERMVQNIPRQYNNITIDGNNFIWLTTDAISRSQLNNATMRRSRESNFMPVRRMNMNGDDVLVRSGAFPPTGDVVGYVEQPSAFVDIALRDNVYAVLDRVRNKIFTYDISGNLLYAFGGSGMQIGVFSQASCITYRGTDLLVLDTAMGAITVFERTGYGILLEEALEMEKRRDFDEAYAHWLAVLQRNSNFDMAYTGIARMMMRQGNYTGAMESYKFAGDVVGYSRAFGELRRGWIQDFYWVIPLAGILIIIGIARGFILAGKINTKHYYEFQRYHLGHELQFALHTLFHPIGGFWDLKHEKRGSMRAANIILVIVVFAFIFSALNTGYIFNPKSRTELNILQVITNVILPVIMWCTASWALTTLFDGQATMRDIYLVTCYSLLPLALTYIPAALLSNVLVLEESLFIDFIRGAGTVWSVLLIFSGIMTLQEYGLVKNTVTTIASLILMGVELFIGMLFILLGNNLWQLIYGIFKEITLRL